MIVDAPSDQDAAADPDPATPVGTAPVDESVERPTDPSDRRDDDRASPTDGEPPTEPAEPTDAAAPPDQPWSWYLQRVSALFLLLLIPLHFVVTVIGGDVGHTTASTMTARLANGRWQGVDWLVLMLALTHSVLALRGRIVLAERSPVATRRLLRVVTVSGAALGVIATYVLLTFV